MSPSPLANPAPEAVFAVAPPPRTATARQADLPTPGPRDESPTLDPLAPPAPQRACTLCPHRGPAGAADGYHQIMLAGGVRYNGLVLNGQYAGDGEIVLIDNTSFPVHFPIPGGAGEGGGAGQTARAAELQQQVVTLVQDVQRGRALANQQAAEVDEERRRSGGLELTVARLQGELDEMRRREQDRRQYDELSRRLGEASVVQKPGLTSYLRGSETIV
jgi:hypothetical protein